MSFDISMIYANIASTLAVALMLLVIKTQYKQDKRIQRIEDDLYLDAGNPTSMPLTKQVYNLQIDVADIKKNCEKLNITMGNLNTMMIDYFKPMNKKKGGKKKYV